MVVGWDGIKLKNGFMARPKQFLDNSRFDSISRPDD